MSRWAGLAAAASDPAWRGFGGLHVVARTAFWTEADLPFTLHGGGAVVRLEPAAAFSKDLLAASPDERAVVVDCSDAPGWLVPSSVVADWMDRHVDCEALDDLLLSHPLYSYATRVDRKGRSRMGTGRLAHWTPGVPTLASLQAPEWLPGDREAPSVHRSKPEHVAAVCDLLDHLDQEFGLLEVDVGSRFTSLRRPAPTRAARSAKAARRTPSR